MLLKTCRLTFITLDIHQSTTPVLRSLLLKEIKIDDSISADEERASRRQF